MMLIRDGGKGGGSMAVREEGFFSYRYTITIKKGRALRWAAMRAILMFH